MASKIGNTQQINIPAHLVEVHPRIAALPGRDKADIVKTVSSDPAAAAIVAKAKSDLAPYLEHFRQDEFWVASRLQMYWKSHATEVYNRGDNFDHAGGKPAPVATVRYPGSRNPSSVYRAPKLEDIPPYEDDTRGIYLINSSLPGQPLEWADPSKSGRIIDGINMAILRQAQTSAQIYWITGDEEYARFAYRIFDTYMRGMYYRNEPIDLDHGHSQTIYGMSTFEVIQEGVLRNLASTYDFLHDWTQLNHSDSLPIYADTFRKWANVTIHNGVPFNNWDLIEADFTVEVAAVLEDDSYYADHHGRQYYFNQVLNEDVTRQWSLRKLADRGFDPKTGIWFESPGYSMGVVAEYITMFNRLDEILGTDLIQSIPVVRLAAKNMVQYAFQNGLTVSWGDSHYGPLAGTAARQMVINAQRHHRREDEVYFTGQIYLIQSLNPSSPQSAGRFSGTEASLESLFERDPLKLDSSLGPLKPSEVFTPIFNAPSVSYFVQRSGSDANTGLMIAESGSLGNHQHANGINMELYGFGLPLAPDSGIGSNYFNADHQQYYAQFPAHNTVVVDGISAYPTMKSHHGFTVNSAWPLTEHTSPESPAVTYSDVSFLEPETQADQRRLMSIIRTSPKNGYYLDVFRSARKDGRDLHHDYFFHGLGQSLDITAEDGTPLNQTPTEKLTFADEELDAYDYLYDKHRVQPTTEYRATYTLDIVGQPTRQLNLWMAGGEGKELLSVLAPPQRSLRDTVPSAINALPMRTLVMRQEGEAWKHPFVTVIEPSEGGGRTSIAHISVKEATGSIGDVLILVDLVNGMHQTIFSSTDGDHLMSGQRCKVQGGYAVLSNGSEVHSVFLGDGLSAENPSMAITLKARGSAYVEVQGGIVVLRTSQPAEVSIASSLVPTGRIEAGGRHFLGHKRDGKFVFDLPAL